MEQLLKCMSIYSSGHSGLEKPCLRQLALQHGSYSYSGTVSCKSAFLMQSKIIFCISDSFLAVLLCTLIYDLLQQPLWNSMESLHWPKWDQALYSSPFLSNSLIELNAYNDHLFKNISCIFQHYYVFTVFELYLYCA